MLRTPALTYTVWLKLSSIKEKLGGRILKFIFPNGNYNDFYNKDDFTTTSVNIIAYLYILCINPHPAANSTAITPT